MPRISIVLLPATTGPTPPVGSGGLGPPTCGRASHRGRDSDRRGRAMKAVRSVEGGGAVVDLAEPPGGGELLEMKATSICGSDLSYIRFGSRSILGHELAGVREDGSAVVVEAIYGCMEGPAG